MTHEIRKHNNKALIFKELGFDPLSNLLIFFLEYTIATMIIDAIGIATPAIMEMISLVLLRTSFDFNPTESPLLSTSLLGV
jgi:hypothetical protein